MTIAAVLLAVAALGLPADGSTAEVDGVGEQDGAGELEAEARADPRAVPHPASVEPFTARTGARNNLAVGWHATSFVSERGSHYVFHSAAIGYLGSFGARGPFVHATALLPLQARQDGRVYAAADYYGRRVGGDLLAGWQWRWRLRDAEVEAGPGLHGTVLWMPGRTGYRDFSALPLGVGATSAVRFRGGATVLSRAMTIGAYVSLAYDFYDPLRADDLAHGWTSRFGVLLGLEGSR